MGLGLGSEGGNGSLTRTASELKKIGTMVKGLTRQRTKEDKVHQTKFHYKAQKPQYDYNHSYIGQTQALLETNLTRWGEE